MLHELAHAFHFYKIGFQFKPIIEAYKNAKNKGLYLKVPSRDGDGRLVSAYAIESEQEYFAELSEAYFGVNDFFPKTRSELKLYDPIGYSATEVAWK